MNTSLKTMTASNSSLEKTSLNNYSEKAEYLVYLKLQIKDLELEAAAITADLSTLADSGGLDDFSYEPGIFEFERVKMSFINRSTWAYSPAIKELQKTEQENGTAKKQLSGYYKFSAL